MIKLENVNYTYNIGRSDSSSALNNVSLEIPDGSITTIIGHTGSGKSTLVQLLNGLEKPQSGKVFVNGTEVTAKDTDLRQLRFKVGMVFQYPEYQLFAETVKLDIAFGPKNMGLSEEEIEKRVLYAANIVGLGKEDLERSPFELSGGQKRRAAIAGVLAMEPEVLVMDEPAAGLDPKGRKAIFDIIKRLHSENPSMIIIFVSHSMEEAAEAADRAVVMNKGTVVMNDSIDNVFSRAEELRSIGLDIPMITQLCIKLKNSGLDIADGIYTVDAAIKDLKRVLGNV